MEEFNLTRTNQCAMWSAFICHSNTYRRSNRQRDLNIKDNHLCIERCRQRHQRAWWTKNITNTRWKLVASLGTECRSRWTYFRLIGSTEPKKRVTCEPAAAHCTLSLSCSIAAHMLRIVLPADGLSSTHTGQPPSRLLGQSVASLRLERPLTEFYQTHQHQTTSQSAL